jgi:hypothetical protein
VRAVAEGSRAARQIDDFLQAGPGPAHHLQ